MLYKWSRFSNTWSVKLFTVALKLMPYLSPAYLFPRYSTTSPFSKFSRRSTSHSNASHLYCERSFTKFKIMLSYNYPSSMGQDRLSDLALSLSHYHYHYHSKSCNMPKTNFCRGQRPLLS